MGAVATGHAKPSNAEHTSSAEEVKFGLHLRPSWHAKVGAFVEYKIHEAFGLQAGLLYFGDAYLMKALEGTADSCAGVLPRYVAMPLILRIYPGEDRQFCIFTGWQLNYLVGG